MITLKTPHWLRAFIFVICLAPGWLRAGTLDDAPFRVVVPNRNWQVADTTAQSLGRNVFLVATINNRTNYVKSVIIKTVLEKPSAASLNELCDGIRDTFINPAFKSLSESDVMFVGQHAKAFTYLITQGNQTNYNQAIIFVADGKGWTIACVGKPEQKDDIRKVLSFYRKKTE